MIKTIGWSEIYSLAVKATGKPAVYVGFGLDVTDKEDEMIYEFVLAEVVKLYGDKTKQYFDVMSGIINGDLFFFETEEQQYQFYKIFEQPLTYSSAIYAMTIAADGTIETENT